MAECEETCKNEIDGVLELLDADILDSEKELQHAFAEAIEEVSSPRLGRYILMCTAVARTLFGGGQLICI